LQNYTDEREKLYGVEQVKQALEADVSEIKNWCKKACLKPKMDNRGHVYFSKSDFDILKKMQELHKKTLEVQAKKEGFGYPVIQKQTNLTAALDNFENSIVEKITNVLSEKMDGFDEIVIELIRAKTENETLRQRVNELNKENFALKNEVSSYKPLALGLYLKKDTEDFIL
jgi:enoyl-[acyl-carrier-protein] reductase (NADH)